MKKGFKLVLWSLLFFLSGLWLLANHEAAHWQVCSAFDGKPRTYYSSGIGRTPCEGGLKTPEYYEAQARVDTQEHLINGVLTLGYLTGVYKITTEQEVRGYAA